MILILDGVICAGKTTLARSLSLRYMAKYFDEPAHLLKTITNGEGNLFDQFYQDPTTHAFTFQLAVYLARIRQLEDIAAKPRGGVYIVERCPESTINIFGAILCEDGALTPSQQKFMEQQRLSSWNYPRFDEATYGKHRCFKILLKASDEDVIERYRRDRAEPDANMITYLKRLNAAYNNLPMCNCDGTGDCEHGWHTVEQGERWIQAHKC